MTQQSAIKGIGNDIVEIERVRQSIDRHGLHFINRIFTQREQDYCYKYKDSVPHFAGRFAAKESVAKALGVGFGAQLSWHDIEILNDEHGKPIIHLKESVNQKFNHPHLLISISHCTHYATAVTIFF